MTLQARTSSGSRHEDISRYPDADDLLDLTGYRGGTRASVFLPLDGARPAETVVRSKNLLRRAARAMRAEGVRRTRVRHLVAEAKSLVEEVAGRPGNAGGLALYLGGDRVRYFLTPIPVPEVVAVGDRFTVAPLLPAFATDGRFLLLAVSQSQISLYAGTRYTMEEVDLEGYELAGWRTLPPVRPGRETHAFVADRGGAGSHAVYHGVAEPDGDGRAALVRYFRGVDQALRQVLGADETPLVLAGVRNTRSVYASVNTYPHLLATGIDGNPRDLTLDQLHRRAWSLVEPVLLGPADAALAQFRDTQGTGRTLDRPRDVIAAAEQGQVRSLLMTQPLEAAGSAPSSSPVQLGSSTRTSEQIERAALATVRNGGEVFLLPDGALGGGATVAAILRY